MEDGIAINRYRDRPALTSIDAVLTGHVVPFGGKTSAIAKTVVDGARRVSVLGIAGDAQADLSVHGGVDKAIHHYPRDHYRFWGETLGPLDKLAAPGAFGENISSEALIESQVCIGDRLRLGTAIVEIAQGRQPCWKQGHRLDDPSVVAKMIETAKCGWYYRVIEEGDVKAGDSLVLLERPHAEWTVERVIRLLIGGEGKRDLAATRALATLDRLAANWRVRAQQMTECR